MKMGKKRSAPDSFEFSQNDFILCHVIGIVVLCWMISLESNFMLTYFNHVCLGFTLLAIGTIANFVTPLFKT